MQSFAKDLHYFEPLRLGGRLARVKNLKYKSATQRMVNIVMVIGSKK